MESCFGRNIPAHTIFRSSGLATFADSHDFFRSATCEDDAGCSKGAESSTESAVKSELTSAKKGATDATNMNPTTTMVA